MDLFFSLFLVRLFTFFLKSNANLLSSKQNNGLVIADTDEEDDNSDGNNNNGDKLNIVINETIQNGTFLGVF
jgi:hypothetical protein